ncbi:tetratricopeptide repeat protein [Parasediminibacterium paludis]|uniref:Tetratricopeptide repeat protein n=1 Tax=Parasediminibacterium paludis TaxID=908966 RepID=A0ABV8PXW7_9BACT
MAQPYATIDLDKDKPKQYENRQLRSEKTGEKKLTANKRLFQNAFTHYNYYFNANNKLNDIITRSKLAFKDDYTKLLPFYNYSLDVTANEKTELDSVIYKCTAGILLHDLRNDWIDNLYLLLGKAYLLRKKYDSAAIVFQYINYAWAPKDDGYDIILGSNASNTNGVFTVSTNEKASIFKKAFSTAPSRNESLLWEARNYLEQDKIGDATGLLSILNSDPVFPKRLQTDLQELLAYNYYKQGSYDSAASHLKRALSNAENRFETARWEYLCGQMYALANKNDDAIDMFDRSIAHTTDPVMEVYARLNYVDLASSKRNNGIQSNLLEMYRLARREKYIRYRDIIYQAIAIIEKRLNNIPNTKLALNEGIKNANPENAALKQKSLLMLADIYYNEKNYPIAANYYDSIQTNLLPQNDKDKVESIRPTLKNISTNIRIIERQDSLQYLAKLSDAERNSYVKKLVRKLRKEQGLKDDAAFEALDNAAFGSPTATVGLFDNKSTSDFYFSNTTLKQKGFSEFKAKWGVRQNVDNWQRQAVTQNVAPSLFTDVDDIAKGLNKGTTNDKPKDLSVEGLMGDIPLTEDQLFASNASIAKAYFANGISFQNELQDYPSAIACFDSLLTRFPNDDRRPQAMLNLAFCYKQISQVVKADSLNRLLKTSYPKQKFTNIFANEMTARDTANAIYQNVYNLFVEGKFEQAKEAKKQADSQLGKSYWTPQLLYIESIYYVKQKDDSTAINRLNSLVSNFPKSPLADKAKTMIDVLKRRAEIEAHLTNFNEEKKEDDATKRIDLSEPTGIKLAPATIAKIDTVRKSPALVAKPIEIKIENKLVVSDSKTFQFVPTDEHYAALLLDKVDETFAGEVKNAFNRFNRERYASTKLNITNITITSQYSMMLIGPFANASDALDYIDKTKPSAAGRIIPWLQASKYSFSIISNKNLDILKTGKEVALYTQFLKGIFPDKF